MRTIAIIFMFFMISPTFSQYNYFKWKKDANFIQETSLSESFAVEDDGTIIYIGTNGKIMKKAPDGQPVVFFGLAPDARLSSNLILRNSSTYGKQIFYITNKNEIALIRQFNGTTTSKIYPMADEVADASWIDAIHLNQV